MIDGSRAFQRPVVRLPPDLPRRSAMVDPNERMEGRSFYILHGARFRLFSLPWDERVKFRVKCSHPELGPKGFPMIAQGRRPWGWRASSLPCVRTGRASRRRPFGRSRQKQPNASCAPLERWTKRIAVAQGSRFARPPAIVVRPVGPVTQMLILTRMRDREGCLGNIPAQCLLAWTLLGGTLLE